MNLILPALAAGALLMFGSGSAGAKTAPRPAPGPGPLPPPPGPNPAQQVLAAQFQAQIADALGRGDFDSLNRIADQMTAAGMVLEAQALRVSANNLRNLGALGTPGSAPPKSPGQPPIAPSPSIPNPPIVPPVITLPTGPVVVPPVVVPAQQPIPGGVVLTPEQTQRRAVATAMATNLRNTSRYQESQALVKQFQAQEGLKPDGLYGPKSALQLATYGIVPPRPRYWARKTHKVDKDTYSAKMVAYSISDPARAADWLAASKVQNDPVS